MVEKGRRSTRGPARICWLSRMAGRQPEVAWPRMHAVATMAMPVATSYSDEHAEVGHDGAMRHRWSFDVLMRTQSKHKEEER